jgi:hypothetical protein
MILFIALDLKNKTREIVVKLYMSYRHHEFHVSDDNVAYSLNKYRRWNLVDIIRDSIGREEYEDVDSSFRLEVSYDLSRSSSTIERLSAAQTTVMDRRFINRESLEAQSKKFNSIDADIKTHFIYPCPRTYSIYYNHKYRTRPICCTNLTTIVDVDNIVCRIGDEIYKINTRYI